ncbi:MAG: MBL fold metallo-hydrolase [Myxococcota bacterium]
MEIRFWGVRGSVAASGSQVARIGGNTSCLEVTHQGHRLILDAGTGIRGLGEELLHAGQPVCATLLFSHLHWDHVQGFPFFTPAYLPTSQLTLYGPPAGTEGDLASVLAKQMEPPNFPVPLSAMRARLRFSTATPGAPLEIGPFRVLPFKVPHPQGCLGYRIDAGEKRFVYMTDVELSLATLTPQILSAMEGADALCLDAQYTPDEYRGASGPSRKGWGHSTMIDAAQVACAAGAKRLFLFHHDPAHNDDTVEAMAEEARNHFERSEPARENKRIILGAA